MFVKINQIDRETESEVKDVERKSNLLKWLYKSACERYQEFAIVSDKEPSEYNSTIEEGVNGGFVICLRCDTGLLAVYEYKRHTVHYFQPVGQYELKKVTIS